MEHNEIELLLVAMDKRKNKRTKLHVILDELFSVAKGARHFIYEWKQVQLLMEKDAALIDIANHFFLNSLLGFKQLAILQCSKLLEENSNSINLKYLLNVASNNKKKYFGKNSNKELDFEFNNDLEKYSYLKSEFNLIKKKRDKEIAHHDKYMLDIYLSKRGEEVLEEVSLVMLEKFLEEAETILMKYYKLAEYPIPNSFNQSISVMSEYGFSFGLQYLEYILRIGLNNLPNDAPEFLKNISLFIKQKPVKK